MMSIETLVVHRSGYSDGNMAATLALITSRPVFRCRDACFRTRPGTRY